MPEALTAMLLTGAIVPRVVAAVLILVVGWLVALVLAAVVRGVLRRTGVDNRLAAAVGGRPGVRVEDGIATAVFYLVLLFVLVAALQALNLTIVTGPLTGLLATVFGYIPRLVGAAVLLLIAWVLATVLRTVVTRALAAARIDERIGAAGAGVDRLAERVGLGAALGTQRLSSLLGLIVYVLIALPVLTAGLDALRMDALTRPISNMLNTILNAIPNVVAAALLLAIAYAVGRVVATLVARLLAGLGVDRLPARLGVGGLAPAAGRAPSDVVHSARFLLLLLFPSPEG